MADQGAVREGQVISAATSGDLAKSYRSYSGGVIFVQNGENPN